MYVPIDYSKITKMLNKKDKEIERLRKENNDLILANKGRKALTGAQFSCMKKLEKEKEWLLKSYVDNLLIQSSNVGYMKLRTDLIDDMQQALKEK